MGSAGSTFSIVLVARPNDKSILGKLAQLRMDRTGGSLGHARQLNSSQRAMLPKQEQYGCGHDFGFPEN